MTCSLLLSIGLSVHVLLGMSEPTWKGGFAAVKITPDKPMWMAGYAARTAPAEGQETDLWAKAMVLEPNGGKKLILVTLDLVGIDRELSQRICKLLMQRYKLPREAVILSVSHTHCGPVVGTTLNTMYFLDQDQAKLVQEYTERLPGWILQAVDRAVGNLEPVTLQSGVGTARFAVNRRENKEADVPALRAKGQLKGPVDHDVPVLVVRDTQDRLKGIVFGYACHATVMAYQKWSGDYPGFAMLELEKNHPGVMALFWAGCGGDQNPLPRRSVELAREYGRQLAQAVEEVLNKPLTSIAPVSAMTYKEIDLPLAEVPSREALVKESQNGDRYVAARAKLLLKKLEAGNPIPATYPYPVQTWRLGKQLTWVVLGGEVVVDYALMLKQRHGANVWVMAYANDVMAYIPSTRVLKEGGYEGAGAMVYYGLPSVWGAKIQDLIMDEAARQITGLSGNGTDR